MISFLAKIDSSQFDLHKLWFLCCLYCPVKSLRACWPSVTTVPVRDSSSLLLLSQSREDHGTEWVLPGQIYVVWLWLPGNFYFDFTESLILEKNMHLIILTLLTTILFIFSLPNSYPPSFSSLPKHAHTCPPVPSFSSMAPSLFHPLGLGVMIFPPFMHITNCPILNYKKFLSPLVSSCLSN